MRPTAILAVALAVPLALTACGDDDSAEPDSAEVATLSYRERITTIDDAVTVWSESDTIEEAHAAAEAAANLVVGADGPGYGDRDGNGMTEGETAVGVLPGLDGTPDGLAGALAGNECIMADVLGGSWDDPTARYAEMAAVIDSWTPDDNTMPQLASHLMRTVGWATLALASDSIDESREYAGHAKLHVDVALDALDCNA